MNSVELHARFILSGNSPGSRRLSLFNLCNQRRKLLLKRGESLLLLTQPELPFFSLQFRNELLLPVFYGLHTIGKCLQLSAAERRIKGGKLYLLLTYCQPED
ncbi:hypothetical protein P4W07_001145 [Salmonella enterica]|nr:hypothetical protein [Salmonella enterica subsp. enterica serovar Bonariensis]EKQ1433417.1 hypothetical protein [Salmonella enterica]